MLPFTPSLLLYGILSILLLTIAGLAGWLYWRKRACYQALGSLPSPPGHWLFGHIPEVWNAAQNKRLFRLLSDWSQQYGSMFFYWTVYPNVILNNSVVIEETINRGMKEGSLIRPGNIKQAWNGVGPTIIGQDGTEWQWRRKAWNPEFNSSGLSGHIAIVHEACSHITNKIRAAAPEQSVSVDEIFVELTMRVISGILLGVPIDPTRPSEGPPVDVKRLHGAMSTFGRQFLRATTDQQTWMIYLPLPESRKYWAARRVFDEFLLPRVNLALQMRDNPAIAPESASPLFRSSMLVRIAAKEPNYTRETLISEITGMLMAGTDTTAHTLSFTMGALALNPEVLQKARDIVDRVWEKYGTLSSESLRELNYLRAIIKETIRMHPVALGASPLEVIKPMVVEGVTLPKGAQLFWSLPNAGRDPDVYENPNQFQPERWLEEGKGLPSPPMVGFGAGYHRCVGEHLAMLEGTIMLAQFIRNFQWELVNGKASMENLQQNMLIYPPDGMPLKFTVREAVPVAV